MRGCLRGGGIDVARDVVRELAGWRPRVGLGEEC